MNHRIGHGNSTVVNNLVLTTMVMVHSTIQPEVVQRLLCTVSLSSLLFFSLCFSCYPLCEPWLRWFVNHLLELCVFEYQSNIYLCTRAAQALVLLIRVLNILEYR